MKKLLISLSVLFVLFSCSSGTKDKNDSGNNDDLAVADQDSNIFENDLEPNDAEMSDTDSLIETDNEFDDKESDDNAVEISDEELFKEGIKLYGTDKNEYGRSLAMDPDGNIFLAGSTEGDLDGEINSGEQDVFLMKFDSQGRKLWTKLYGTEKIDSGNYIRIDSSGNTYLTGYTAGTLNDNTSKGSYDAFLMKLDKNGEMLWQRQIGTAGADTGSSIAFDNDENVYISGYVDGSTEDTIELGTPDAFIAKFAPDGTELWLKRWGSEGFNITYRAVFHNEFIYIVGATDGDAGGTGFLGGMFDTFLTKIDTSGNISWTKQWGTTGSEISYSFTINGDSDIFLCGSASGAMEEAGLNDMGISMTKLDSEGKFEWTNIWKSGEWQGANSIIFDESGSFYLSGFSLGDLDGNKNAGESDIFLIKVDSSGNKIWTKLFGGEGTEMPNSSLIDKYGNIYVTGGTDSNLDGEINSGGYDIFLIKFSAEDL